MADKVSLEGMVFYGYHGVKPEEKALGQRFLVDIEAEADLSQAGTSDNIADTVNYSRMFRLAREVMEGPSHNLLESLAQTIASRILTELGPQAVRVRIRKPSAPVPGALAAAVVEVYRHHPASRGSP